MADPDDAPRWTDHIARLAEHSQIQSHLADAARQLVRTRYDWEILGAKLSRTYTGWLEGPA